MKKFLLAFLMILASVLVLKAGPIGDFYNKNVRPATKLIQDATPEMLAEDNLKAASQAVVTLEQANKLMADAAKMAAPVKLAKSVDQDGAKAQVYVNMAGDNSECLFIATSPQGNVVVYTAAPQATIQQALDQIK